MAPQLTFRVEDANLDVDFDELMATYWTSWTQPNSIVGRLTFPHLGTGTVAEAEAFSRMKKLMWESTRSALEDRWLKVTETGSGRIVAGAMWKEYSENPYRAPGPPAQAPWWDEGSEIRDLTEQFYTQLYSFRRRMMACKHACGCALWTLPEYRKYGVGNLVGQHFTELIDRLGLECYLEGSPIGTPLYQKYGFVVVDFPIMRFKAYAHPRNEWKQMVRELQATPISIMWRPIKGVYEEGKTALPWESEPQRAKL